MPRISHSILLVAPLLAGLLCGVTSVAALQLPTPDDADVPRDSPLCDRKQEMNRCISDRNMLQMCRQRPIPEIKGTFWGDVNDCSTFALKGVEKPVPGRCIEFLTQPAYAAGGSPTFTTKGADCVPKQVEYSQPPFACDVTSMFRVCHTEGNGKMSSWHCRKGLDGKDFWYFQQPCVAECKQSGVDGFNRRMDGCY